MSEREVERGLAALVAADIAGFSRLTAADEEGTLLALRRHRAELIDTAVSEFGGRIANTAGDSLLIEFPSAVDALRCAVKVQREMARRNADIEEDRRILFRVGINVGDVVRHEGDLLGDGVNIAARLEALAEPGGILISRAARDQVRDRLDIDLQDMGEVEVKNIARPVRVFHVAIDNSGAKPARALRPRRRAGKRMSFAGALLVLVCAAVLAWWQPWSLFVEAASVDKMAVALPDEPSIAVMPFEVASTDESDAVLADGLTEDIINGLSRISSLFVLAYSSSSTIPSKVANTRVIAETFGVRYVLFGKVRRQRANLQITVQLVDAVRGRQVWSAEFERPMDDLFAIQNDVTKRIVETLAVTLPANEVERLYARHTSNIEAYQLFLRARKMVFLPSREGVEAAEGLFQRVIELDPAFAGGYAGLGLNYSIKARFQFGDDPEQEKQLSMDYARKAIEVDPDFAWSYIALGAANLAHNDPEAAVAAMDQALAIQPNGYEENLWMGFYAHFTGQHALAVKRLERADRISPADTGRKISFMAMAYFMNGDYERSVELWKVRREKYSIGNPISYVFLCAALVELGRIEEAQRIAAEQRELQPKFRLSTWRFVNLYKRASDRERLLNAAEAAGIPK